MEKRQHLAGVTVAQLPFYQNNLQKYKNSTLVSEFIEEKEVEFLQKPQ